MKRAPRVRTPLLVVLGGAALLVIVGLISALERDGDGVDGLIGMPQSAPDDDLDTAPAQEGARARSHVRDPLRPPTGRPSVPGTLRDENRHAPPAEGVADGWVPAVVLDEQVLIGDAALPWQYWLDPAVPEQFDEATIHAAVASWSGPGTRWTAVFAGYRTTDGPVPDGHSTIFVEATCTDLTTANAYLFTDGGIGVNRFGTAASQILEADIGICPRVLDDAQIGRAIRHEVGHVVGLGHLCDPDDPCWHPSMGSGPHGCAVMFWQARACQNDLTDGERLAVATLYPTLRRLSGPDADTTAARASFGVVDDDAAPVVVVAAHDTPIPTAAAAATLAARSGGAYLVSQPAGGRCLDGVAAAEASRTLARRGMLVLVGTWPADCDRMAYDWDVRLRRVGDGDPVTAGLRLARLGGSPSGDGGAVLLARHATLAEAAAGATLAGQRGQPLLPVPPDGTTPAIAEWLLGAGDGVVPAVGAVTVVGDHDPAVVDDLSARGLPVTVITGADALGTALAVGGVVLEETTRSAGRRGVVLIGMPAGAEALAAVVVAVADDAAVVTSDMTVDAAVVEWLRAVAPTHGWSVTVHGVLPPATSAVYGALVGRG